VLGAGPIDQRVASAVAGRPLGPAAWPSQLASHPGAGLFLTAFAAETGGPCRGPGQATWRAGRWIPVGCSWQAVFLRVMSRRLVSAVNPWLTVVYGLSLSGQPGKTRQVAEDCDIPTRPGHAHQHGPVAARSRCFMGRIAGVPKARIIDESNGRRRLRSGSGELVRVADRHRLVASHGSVSPCFVSR
jgi:hypothetical protein